MILSPGNILQHMYVKERLRLLKPGKFVEVGVGRGHLSKILLDLGWEGVGFDLSSESLKIAAQINAQSIRSKRYFLKKGDWLKASEMPLVDLIISTMVLEHLDSSNEKKFIQKMKRNIKPKGRAIILVPSCPDYWGVDDELAGHYRRYTFNDMASKVKKAGFHIVNLVGLTFPLSNLTFPISEFLVAQAEKKKKDLSILERTKLSGNRNVCFKTSYPFFFNLVLNEIVLYPFHLLQKFNLKNAHSLVIYAELDLKN